jgi:hypothetical protein
VGIDCSHGCSVRDVWNHADLPTLKADTISAQLASHDSAFFILTPQHL